MSRNVRKRRAPALAESEDEADDSPAPAPTQSRRQSGSRQRRRESPSSDDNVPSADDADGNADLQDTNAQHQQQMVKNLVRLALSSEYTRVPIKRTDIFAKVLGRQGRQFRVVFDEAQMALRQTMGMELVELPARDRVTLKERRAAQSQRTTQTQGAGSQAATGSNAWVLRSVLPAKFRTPEILPPPNVPTEALEAAYIGLYSFVIAVIVLNGGTLPEPKLERYLRRTNTDQNTPVDRTDKLLQRMIREGYLVKVKENVGGDEVVEYMVGTRGKVEVGEKGVRDMVKTVYGLEGAEAEELEKRLERSLKVVAASTQTARAAE